MKFRKKPIVVEAFQFNREWIEKAWSFNPDLIKHPEKRRWCVVKNYPNFLLEAKPIERLRIITLEGEMTANVGDWIIQGVAGEFYPCKPDIFEKTYEPLTNQQ